MSKNSYLRLFTCFLLLFVLSAGVYEAQGQRKKDLERARKIVKEGDKFYNQKNYREAINRYAEAIMVVPNFAPAYFMKGYAHYNSNEFEFALTDLNAALANGYDKPLEVYKIRWYLNYLSKNYDAALRDASEAARLDPNNSLYSLALGDIYRQKLEWNEALAFYKKGAQQDSKNPDVHYFIAICNFSLNNTVDQGLAALEAIRRNTKYLGESYFYAADAFNKSRKIDEAAQYYKKAIELKPEIYGPYPALSAIYQSQNRLEEAIDTANQGLRYYPTDSSLFTSLSWYYSLAERHIEAINSAKAAIKQAPDQYMAYTNLCRAYNDTKQYQQAVQFCGDALRLRPGDGETHLYIGRAYDALKQPEKARENYRKAVNGLLEFTKGNPDYADGFYLLGNAYFLVERDDDAIEAYKRSLELAPRFARARYTLGVVYLTKGNKAAAREQYNILKDVDASWAEKLRQELDGK